MRDAEQFHRFLDLGMRGVFFFLSLGATWVGANPPEIFQYQGTEETLSWARIQNRELRIDFSPVDPHKPVSAFLRGTGQELVHADSGVDGLWLDLLNDEEIHGGTANFVWPSPDHSVAIARTTSPWDRDLILEKSVRLLPEGANLEVMYRVVNPTSQPSMYKYSLVTAWSPGGEGSQNWYHLPRVTEITRFDADGADKEVTVPGVEFDENWFCVDSPATDLSMFLVTKEPLVEWEATPIGNGVLRVETTLVEGTLKPGESIEGTYWISMVHGIGIPISAGPKYIAGLVWNECDAIGSYELQSRLVGMPKPLKKLRVFSAVGEPGSDFKVVPKYIRRSRLSNTEVVTLPLPAYGQKSGKVEVEQSIYSSSENLGYWKVLLKTPELLLASSMGKTMYDVNHIPGVDGTVRHPSIDPVPPRESVSPMEISQQFDHSDEGFETIPGPSQDWEEKGDINDLTAATLTEKEEAALLAVESIY